MSFAVDVNILLYASDEASPFASRVKGFLTVLRQHGVPVPYSRDADFRRFDFLEVRDPFVD